MADVGCNSKVLTEDCGLTGAAVGFYFIASNDADLSLGTLGLILVLSSIGGWQYHRLNARVNALTKLLSEVGYPGEA